ncbi:MAG: hypothetical protein LBG80_01910 [Bacteroidales bacterium]|nr:hypothetical protein [Bacteroidales bacterium]
MFDVFLFFFVSLLVSLSNNREKKDRIHRSISIYRGNILQKSGEIRLSDDKREEKNEVEYRFTDNIERENTGSSI